MATKFSEKNDSANARDQLLEAACQIMRDGDTVDLSLSELSLRSGLNSALVKYYFGNKNGLMLALLERDMTNVVQAVASLVAKDMPPQDKLRRHIGAVIDTYYEFPYLNRLLLRMIRDAASDEAKRIADLYLKPLSDAYETLIAQGVEQGKFRDVDPQHFYFTVTGACDRFFNMRQVLKHCYGQDALSDDLRDSYREDTVELIMRGLLL